MANVLIIGAAPRPRFSVTTVRNRTPLDVGGWASAQGSVDVLLRRAAAILTACARSCPAHRGRAVELLRQSIFGTGRMTHWISAVSLHTAWA